MRRPSPDGFGAAVAVHGGFRTGNVLDKPFRTVAAATALSKRITPRGMRTFQDLCCAAQSGIS